MVCPSNHSTAIQNLHCFSFTSFFSSQAVLSISEQKGGQYTADHNDSLFCCNFIKLPQNLPLLQYLCPFREVLLSEGIETIIHNQTSCYFKRLMTCSFPFSSSHCHKVYIVITRWSIKHLLSGCQSLAFALLQCVPLKGKHHIEDLQASSDLLRDTVLQPQVTELCVALRAQM